MRVNGEAIRAIAERSGLSGTALAEGAGIDRTHLSHVLAGRKQLSPAAAKRVAEVLKVPLVAILADPKEEP